MLFCVMRLNGAVATSPESAWPMYRDRGWVRVSDWMPDMSQVVLGDYADAAALEPEPAKSPAAKTTSKEK
jgi:hypothetical protein